MLKPVSKMYSNFNYRDNMQEDWLNVSHSAFLKTSRNSNKCAFFPPKERVKMVNLNLSVQIM